MVIIVIENDYLIRRLKMIYCYNCIIFSKNNIMCDGYDN